MNLKTVIPLVVALALAVVAAKLGKDIMSKGSSSNPGTNTMKLVVAKEPLLPGSPIRESDITLRDMPADSLSQSAFHTPAEVIGRVVISEIAKGQLVVDSFLAPKGATGGAQAMVPEGMRAITLEVNEFSGVAGLLIPGSHVDLVQTIQSKDDKAGPMAKTLVENLKVIAVGRRLGNPPQASADVEPAMVRSVTLLATADQAVAIDLASHVGSPRLVLRNTSDEKPASSKGVTVAELRGAQETSESQKVTDMMAQLLLSGPTTRPTETKVDPVVKPVVKNYREVEVIRAGTSSNVRVTAAKGPESISDTSDKLLDDSDD